MTAKHVIFGVMVHAVIINKKISKRVTVNFSIVLFQTWTFHVTKQFRSLSCLYSLALTIPHRSTNFEYFPLYTQSTFLTHKCPYCCFPKSHWPFHSTLLITCTACTCIGLSSTAPYSGADKSLARPTSRCILFDGENIPFDVSLVIYINSTNIPPIMIINRIYETQNLLSL